MQRRIIHVKLDGSSTAVGYYEGASSSSVARAAATALGLPDSKILVLEDDAGEILVGPPLPPSAIAVVRSRPVPEDNTAVSLGEPSTDLPNDDAFRGQWIKFERVLSHLANERTWLAWLRVALTLLAAAFTLW